MKLFTVLSFFLVLSGCTKKTNTQNELWIYTSLYKDTISNLEPLLKKDFPNVSFKFFQAGSEEVAAKVQAEDLSGSIKADILISSDRFWYEDLSRKDKFVPYKPKGTESVSDFYKNPQGLYTTLSFPVMVIAYNSDSIKESEAPRTFKELTQDQWKGKVSIGSPLASGTSFTTVAFLQSKYGWEYFKSLRKNDLIAEGGNSGVIRRLQSKERPVGIVLLENVLRLKNTDPRIKFILPEDGAVVQSNVLALVKKQKSIEHEQLQKQVADWFFGKNGQAEMVNSFMYASTEGFEAPAGAPTLNEVLKTAKPWTTEFLNATLESREKLKEEFSKIVF